MHRSDADIIAAVRGGATRAYAVLIDRYKDKAYALALRLLRNGRDAEEACQDAFLRAYEGLGTFRGDAAFGTWFYRILYNGCLSRLKRVPRETQRWEGDDAGTSGDASPLEEAERNDLARRLGAAINRLPEKYATVLSLYYLQDLTYSEICSVTDLPLVNVKVHLYRARLLLTKQLHREALFDEVAL